MEIAQWSISATFPQMSILFRLKSLRDKTKIQLLSAPDNVCAKYFAVIPCHISVNVHFFRLESLKDKTKILLLYAPNNVYANYFVVYLHYISVNVHSK